MPWLSAWGTATRDTLAGACLRDGRPLLVAPVLQAPHSAAGPSAHQGHSTCESARFSRHQGTALPLPHSYPAATALHTHCSACIPLLFACALRSHNNPSQEALARKIAAIEGGEAALVTSSGMSGISTTLLTFLKAGDHLLIQVHRENILCTVFVHGYSSPQAAHARITCMSIGTVLGSLTFCTSGLLK